MSTYHWEMLAAIGGPAVGVLLLLWAFNRLIKGWAGTPIQAPVYGRHRALEPSPVEVIRLPQGHTEEHPIAHVGASADWSPTAELALVPARPLDPAEAERVEEEQQLHDELDRVLAPILDQLARVGHEDSHTCEWDAAELAAIVAAGRPR